MKLDALPDGEAGVSLTIVRDETGGAFAPLRVEHAGLGLIRLSVRGRPLLWARQLPRWAGVQLVAPAGGERPPLPLPPITMDDVRRARGEPTSVAWIDHWARTFAHGLSRAVDTPLVDGTWHVAVKRGPRGIITAHALARPTQTLIDWGLNGSGETVTLRAPSRADAARVKAWRKVARDQALPPLLAMFVSGLDLFVLLDGHDRALAAMEEGTDAPILTLSKVRATSYAPDERARAGITRNAERALAEGAADDPRALARINERLVRAYAPPRFFTSKTRSAPMPGGRARWIEEVTAALSALGPNEPTDVLDELASATAQHARSRR